jgi:chemotaxis protein MotB
MAVSGTFAAKNNGKILGALDGVRQAAANLHFGRSSHLVAQMDRIPASAAAPIQAGVVTSAPVAAATSMTKTAAPSEMKALETVILEKFRASKTLIGLETQQNEKELDISFSTDRIFPGGKASFDAGKDFEIAELVAVIQAQAKNFDVQVEGHTDNVPVIKNRKQFSSNWELSGARAAAVVRLFERAGFAQNSLEAISYGESRPKFTEKARNRRLVIRLMKKEVKGS